MTNKPSVIVLRVATWLLASTLVACAQQPAAEPPKASSAPSRLVATVYGGAGQVSGSLSVLDTGNGRWMIDCGAFSPDREVVEIERVERAVRQSAALPVDAQSIAALLVTHAHTDHVGRIPLLVDGGFRGPIYLTGATADLLAPMLRMQIRYDEGRVRAWCWSKQARERATRGERALNLHWHANCRYRAAIAEANLKTAQTTLDELKSRLQRDDPELRVSLCQRCAEEEVATILALCRRLPYGRRLELAPGVAVQMRDAGHIPGSASVLFQVAISGRTRRVLFSGDVGNDLSPLFAGPQPAPAVDAVFIETTYGDTFRDPSVREERAQFRRLVGEVVRRGDVAWIPVFALDRTQKILHELRLAQQEKSLSEQVPIYCSSATAIELTSLYRQHQQDGWFRDAVARDPAAFQPAGLRRSDHMPKNLPRPCILLTTSGMMEHGWSRRLIDRLAPEPWATIFLVGYQDPLSPGGLLKKAMGLMREGSRDQASVPLSVGAQGSHTPDAGRAPPVLDLGGQKIPIRANVRAYRCFSGHADAKEMDAWLARVPRDAAVTLVHGGPEELRARAAQLVRQGWKNVRIAKPGEPIELGR